MLYYSVDTHGSFKGMLLTCRDNKTILILLRPLSIPISYCVLSNKYQRTESRWSTTYHMLLLHIILSIPYVMSPAC